MKRIAGLCLVMFVIGCGKSPRVEPQSNIKHPLTDKQVKAIVIEELTNVLGVSKDSIRPESVFSQEPINGDDLDFVESIMSIEDRLGVSIEDKDIHEQGGTTKLADFMKKLKVSDLQDLTIKVYKRKYGPKK